ncbi:MAG: hypothetical protein PVH84_10965 [Candidatus Aminicenantes bacterium]|jgi:hypothetical protein
MSWFFTTGILIALGVFAILLFINPNLSWMVKRVGRPVYSIFSKGPKEKKLKTQDYGFQLNEEENNQNDTTPDQDL